MDDSGVDYGIETKVELLPNQHLEVEVLSKEDSIVAGGRARVNPEVFTNGIADIYLADVLGPAEAATKTARPEKTSLYRIGRDYPVLLSVDHGTLMLRSYYGDDSDFALTPISLNRFVLRNTSPFDLAPAAPGRRNGTWAKERTNGNGRDWVAS